MNAALPLYSPPARASHVAAADNTVKIWHALDGKYHMTLEGHSEGISDVAWSYDSQWLCTASDDTTIRVWSLDSVGCVLSSVLSSVG